MDFLKRFAPHTFALMRIVTGFLFLWHGSQKLFGFPEAGEMPPFVQYVGGSVEFFGGLLVAIGLFTRVAAFLCSGQMAVAYWTVHAPQALLPIVNQGELAALYCFVFLYIACHGSGIWSVDAARGRAES